MILPQLRQKRHVKHSQESALIRAMTDRARGMFRARHEEILTHDWLR
ncbi:hypothetical protein J2S73_003517 [Amorphus orientalis]|uniref:Uncharacterized protein n=1 Tax=Amorphus orientalis TaxID=649198 RepID=A0AAE4AU71_9HYPH|nr:hypothetical protein [Amorphus orientalis]